MHHPHNRWHPESTGHGGQRRSGGAGPLFVLLVIVACLLLIGMSAPSIRFESLLALIGFW